MNRRRTIIILIVLMLISIANNYLAKDIINLYGNYYIKELIWYLIGFIIIYIISKLNIDYILNKSFYLYLFGNFLLLLTLIIGKEINGAKGWLSFGPLSFQPSEFMKIFLILYLQKITIKYKLSDFKYIILTLIITLIPSILTFLEPDTGAVLIYLIVWITFLFLKRLNKWYYISTILVSVVALTSFLILYYQHQNIFIDIFGTNFFYRMDRITNFIKGEGYQLNEALKSISNSGLFGIEEKVYIPESTTDFALTLLIGNFGFIGLIFTLTIYTLLFHNLLSYKQNKYILYPLISILLFQYITNTLMNIGLFPIIGITLPFISYGGSSLLSYMIIIGILLKEKVPTSDTYL